jgi:hypothetical protein
MTQRYSLDPHLGAWVNKQRDAFKRGRMDFERKVKLDEIGFEFFVLIPQLSHPKKCHPSRKTSSRT